MLSIVIEPAFLAVPPIAANEAEVEAIIERIAGWSSLAMRRSVVSLLQMTDTMEVLGATNSWPTTPNVESLLELYNLKGVYTASEVSRLINAIIERARPVLDVVGLEVTDCTPDPIPPIDYQEPRLSQLGYNTLATVCSGVRRFLFLAPGCHLHALHFRAKVDQATTTEACQCAFQAPFSVYADVPLVLTPSRAIELVKADEIWHNANSTEDLHFAISLKMIEIARATDDNLDIEDIPRFSLGSDFYRSLQRTQSGPRGEFGGTTLETCARLVLGNPKKSVDRFTDGARSQNSTQITRATDGALAFRTHITKRHSALRLNMWQLADKSWELANVSVKDELNIAAGDPTLITQRSW